MLAQIIAALVSSALNATKLVDTSPSHFPEATTQFLDMDIFLFPCNSLEMDLGHIQVVCTAQGTSVEARRKIHDCSCAAIEPKFSPMDFSKLATHDASKDLGMMVLAQKMMLDKFTAWCQQLDLALIFQVPSVLDFHDHRAVASSSHVNLLMHYKALPLASVLKYQAYINEWRSDMDVKSCDWVLQVLELSTTPSLLIQIKQSFYILPTTQQDGVTLFKLLVDKLDSNTFKNTKLLQDYITTFCLDAFPEKTWLWVHLASRQLPRCWPISTYPLTYSTITFLACLPAEMRNSVPSVHRNWFSFNTNV
jgi:hypothetical protein